jgi:hypothetical protein
MIKNEYLTMRHFQKKNLQKSSLFHHIKFWLVKNVDCPIAIIVVK